MKKRHIALISAALAVSSLLVAPVVGQAAERAVIHFADLGAIRDWRSGPDDSLLVEGTGKRWYKATFMSPCKQLRFANAIAFVTDPTGQLDSFSSVLVGGQRCWFKTFDKTDAPQ